MGRRITQHQARSLGKHHGVGVALPRLAQVEFLGLEGHMHILGHVVGVDDKAVVLVAALVEDLAVEYVESAKIRHKLLELYAPLDAGLSRAHNLAVFQLAQGLHQGTAGKEDFALGTVVARKCRAAQADEVVLGKPVDRQLVVALSLAPYTAGKVDIFVFLGVE